MDIAAGVALNKSKCDYFIFRFTLLRHAHLGQVERVDPPALQLRELCGKMLHESGAMTMSDTACDCGSMADGVP
jgi:hypothetical protein